MKFQENLSNWSCAVPREGTNGRQKIRGSSSFSENDLKTTLII